MSAEKQKTLLLVEDEAIIAMSEKLALERYEYAVIIADSGEAAVAAVNQTPGIDLILMDINLGTGMDGTEAAAIILKSHDLPVVFLSSHMEPEIVAKTEKITSYGYVVKDSSGTVLDASIKMAFKLFEAKISEKKKELALSQSNELLAKLARLVPGVIYQYRLDPDGRSAFPYASPGINDIYEVSPEEVRLDATPVFARLHPDDYDLVAGAIQASAHTLNTFFCEFRVVLPRQGLRWRWSQAHPERLPDGGTLWHGIISDITEQKLAEQALRASQQLIEGIVNAIPVRVFWKDVNLVYLGCNSAFARDAGFADPKEIIGKDDFQMTWRDQADLYRRDDRQVIESGHAKLLIEEPQTTPEGLTIHLMTSKMPLRNAKGEIIGVLGTYMDITERKRAESDLRENDYKLELAMQAADMAWWEMDVASGGVSFEKRKAAMLGYPPEKFVHYKDFMALVHPEDNERVMNAMREHLRGTTEKYDVEYRILTNSGKYKWFHDIGSIGKRDANNKPLDVTGLVINISERKLAEEALRLSEAKQASALQMTKAGHWEYDVDLDLFTFNDNFYRIFRTTAAAVGGYQMSSAEYARRFCHPDDASQVGSETRMAIESADANYSRQIEHRIIYADGEIGTIAVRFFIIKDAQGRTIKTYGVNQDISERKRAEEEIKRQLAEKEVLLKEVHHRIKNNIASIGGILSLKLRSTTLPETIAVLQDTAARVDSMRVLYDNLLLSKNFKEVSVKKYVESLTDAIVSLFPGQAKVRLNQQFVDFHLDPKRLFPLGIIVNELLTNILKYAFAGKKSGQIRLSLSKQDRRVSLVLQDNGVGLPEGFDPESSAGFGLKLVKMLSQQLGGSFTIEKHKGTRCTVSFDV